MIIPVLMLCAIVGRVPALFHFVRARFSKPLNNPAHEPRQPKQHKRKHQRSTKFEQ